MTVSKPICPHLRTVVDTKGGYHFSYGEPWDDIVEELLCLDCLEILPENKPETTQEERDRILKELGYD
jgi:hypothetical protein